MIQNVTSRCHLSSKQKRVAKLLVEGRSQTFIAEHLHTTRQTIARWLKMPHFRAEIALLEREAEEMARTRLFGLFNATVAALSDELTGGLQPAGTAIALLKVFGAERLLTAAQPPIESTPTTPLPSQ